MDPVAGPLRRAAPGAASSSTRGPRARSGARGRSAPVSPGAMTTEAPPIDRRPGLDRLRGFAAALVVCHHVGLREPLTGSALDGPLPNRLLQAITHNGYEAVFIFFVLSGYLITRRELDRTAGHLGALDLRAFVRRRATRIGPLLLALVVVLSAMHLMQVPEFTIGRPGQSLGGAVFAALGLHLHVYEARTGYLPGAWDVLWSLSIEELFYLGFPLVARLLGGGPAFGAAAWALAISLPFQHAALAGKGIALEKAGGPAAAALAMGVFAAWARGQARAPPAAPLGAVGGAGLLACLLAGPEIWGRVHNGLLLLLTLSTAALVVALDRPGPARARGPLVAFGRLSYELYLTHMFVVLALVGAWRALGGPPGARWVLVPFGLLGSAALGALTARGFTRPVEARLRGGQGPQTG